MWNSSKNQEKYSCTLFKIFPKMKPKWFNCIFFTNGSCQGGWKTRVAVNFSTGRKPALKSIAWRMCCSTRLQPHISVYWSSFYTYLFSRRSHQLNFLFYRKIKSSNNGRGYKSSKCSVFRKMWTDQAFVLVQDRHAFLYLNRWKGGVSSTYTQHT